MGEREVIEHFEKEPGWIHAKELQERYNIKNVYRNLNSLESRGYLESKWEIIPLVGRKRLFRRIPQNSKDL